LGIDFGNSLGGCLLIQGNVFLKRRRRDRRLGLHLHGLQLLHALRLANTTQRNGFILITGTPSPEIVREGQQLGLNNMVRKPFTSATVKAAIESVVGKL
jgi:CheY-like chemotaxis protein